LNRVLPKTAKYDGLFLTHRNVILTPEQYLVNCDIDYDATVYVTLEKWAKKVK
jgi:hypothetical protein